MISINFWAISFVPFVLHFVRHSGIDGWNSFSRKYQIVYVAGYERTQMVSEDGPNRPIFNSKKQLKDSPVLH